MMMMMMFKVEEKSSCGRFPKEMFFLFCKKRGILDRPIFPSMKSKNLQVLTFWKL